MDSLQGTSGIASLHQGNGGKSGSNSPARGNRPPLSPSRKDTTSSVKTPGPLTPNQTSRTSTPGAFTPNQVHFKTSHIEALQRLFLASPVTVKPSDLSSPQIRDAKSTVSPYTSTLGQSTGLTPVTNYIEDLHSKIEWLSSKINRLNQTLDNQMKTYDVLKENHEQTKTELEVAIEKLKTAQDQIHVHETNLHESTLELEKLNQAITKYTEEKEALENTIEKLNREGTASKEEKEKLTAQLSDKENALAALNESASKTKTQTQQLHIILEQAKAKLTSYNSKIRSLEGELDKKLELEKSLIITQQQLEKAKAEIADLKEQNTRITEKTAYLNSLIGSGTVRTLSLEEDDSRETPLQETQDKAEEKEEFVLTQQPSPSSSTSTVKASDEKINLQQNALDDKTDSKKAITDSRRKSFTPKKGGDLTQEDPAPKPKKNRKKVIES